MEFSHRNISTERELDWGPHPVGEVTNGHNQRNLTNLTRISWDVNTLVNPKKLYG